MGLDAKLEVTGRVKSVSVVTKSFFFILVEQKSRLGTHELGEKVLLSN